MELKQTQGGFWTERRGPLDGGRQKRGSPRTLAIAAVSINIAVGAHQGDTPAAWYFTALTTDWAFQPVSSTRRVQ
ncbi:hypothetical protein J7T55_004965 [Diaporthe amygdali]|uniref:uncharacterized protein n=1 Tax=Phomopsis amygdali TaxID=1214568 RepID=UPI0022FE37A2|nr:uncharacterized protein J7T55_004965 [Diaporthe amygdali]KAJ0114721.1 hypothetical protein J7T55_004965 [Diaporthe amygdali]